MVGEGDRALAPGSPDRPQNRFQAEAVLVGAKDLDRDPRVGGRFFEDDIRQPFLKASASSGVADFGFLGLGRCRDQLIVFNASRPR